MTEQHDRVTYTAKVNGTAMRSMLAEQVNFGTYQTKDKSLILRLSQQEKEELKELADALDMPMTLLVRVLIKVAYKRHTFGEDVLDGFKMPSSASKVKNDEESI